MLEKQQLNIGIKYGDLIALLLLGGVSYLLICLVSFSPTDPSNYSATYPPISSQNWGGWLGTHLASYAHFLFGIGSYFLVLPVITSIAIFIRDGRFHLSLRTLLGWLCCFLAICGFGQTVKESIQMGEFILPTFGATGSFASKNANFIFGHFGKWVFFGTLILCAISLITPLGIRLLIKKMKGKWVSRKKKSEMETSIDAAKTQSKIVTPEPNITAPIQSKILFKSSLPSLSKILKKSKINSSRESTSHANVSIAKDLENILSDFGVSGQIINIQPGPVVTVYEFQPKSGTKQSKIIGLTDDIALALKVDSIFISPVAGKKALGIQVPNDNREIVRLGDLTDSRTFSTSGPLVFAMGKSLDGKPIYPDLAKMPHLLMAGQTGSGKSVAINGLVCSLIMKSNPEDLRMILVDPKILELKIYEGIPHLLMPVITQPDKAAAALKWAIHEMERRYELMESAKVRNIEAYNLKGNSSKEQSNKLPFIIVIIDELADLMLSLPKEVETSIQRLAQKARASGIHLVLATQRPSVDVITGVIKANLPCRVAFKVFSRGDSRTILDSMGAERLLGQGDMLFLRPGAAKIERIQNAFLEDSEVLELVKSIQNDKPQFDEEAMDWIESHTQSTEEKIESIDDDDPKWDQALAIAQSEGQISASYLQRQLKIGYNRAARLVENMAKQGLLDKSDGAKPRKWLGSAR